MSFLGGHTLVIDMHTAEQAEQPVCKILKEVSRPKQPLLLSNTNNTNSMAKPRRSQRLSRRRGSPSYSSPEPPRVKARTAKAEREATRLKNGGKPKRYFFTSPEDDEGRDMRRKRKRTENNDTDSGCEASGSAPESTPERTPKVARTGQRYTPAPHGAFMNFEYDPPSTPVPQRVTSGSEASEELLLTSGGTGAQTESQGEEVEAESAASPVVTPARQIARSTTPTRVRARRSGAPPPFTTPTVRFQAPSDDTPSTDRSDDGSAADDEDFWNASLERGLTVRGLRDVCQRLRDRSIRNELGFVVAVLEDRFESDDELPSPFEDLVGFYQRRDLVAAGFGWSNNAGVAVPTTYADPDSVETRDEGPATASASDDINLWEAYCDGLGRPTEADMARVPSRPRGMWTLLDSLFSTVTPAMTESVSQTLVDMLTTSTASSSA